MKLPISWLNEYVSTEGIEPKKLADMLLNIGFEVEEIINIGEGIENVVAGKILDIKKHQDADKLQVCMVDVAKEIITIVTGADNIAIGDIVPIALDGALLPGGKKIVSAPLRGVMSYGMMCSGGELNVDNLVIDGAEVDGILILPPQTELGADIKDILRLNDVVLDVSLTANRPDCQSIYGLAREVAAMLGRKIKPLSLKYKTYEFNGVVPSVKIENYDVCSRYTGQVIDNVVIEKSPDWMRDRLRMVGIRSINNIVDITNYVLTEVGQPLHAFDMRFIANNSLNVRFATENEIIIALDEKKYNLKSNMLVIADSEKPLAIAGVMGGEHSGILNDTACVLLEAARFAKGSVRSTSRALGLRSDSSARYEKGVDWQSVEVGRDRALSLINQLKAGRVMAAFCADSITPPKCKTIKTTANQISELLGITVKVQTIAKVLKALEFDVLINADNLTVNVPLYREDVDNFTDLAEEVIRFYGYDNIQSTLLKKARTTMGSLPTRQVDINKIKNIMCGMGAYEITTYSFINNKLHDKLNLSVNDELRNVITILNPLSEEYAVMRTQLSGNMLSTVSLNLSRKNKDFRLFEIGRTYIADELPLKDLPKENDTLCCSFVGKDESFYTIKAAVITFLSEFMNCEYTLDYSKKSYMHPGISADIIVNGDIVGFFGKVHPQVSKNFDLNEDVYLAEINLEKVLAYYNGRIAFKPLPKFPAVERDLAVVVKEEVSIGEIINVANMATELCGEAQLFDIYRGEQIESGYKSIALSFKLQSQTKTLTDAEIQNAMDCILKALELKCGVKIR